MTEVIFFDLDETLVAQEAAFRQAYRATTDWLSREVATAESTPMASAIPLAAQTNRFWSESA